MSFDEKIERLMEMQYICIQQLNSIIEYIEKCDNISVESHQDILLGGEMNDTKRTDTEG